MALSQKEKFPNKLLGLEALRFVASLSIILYHYQHFYYYGVESKGLSQTFPFYRLCALFYDYGFCAVPFFWSLSGFIFFLKYRACIASKQMGFKQFFTLRFSRLYPLHILTLGLVALLQKIYFLKQGTYFVYPYNDWKHFFLQIFLASDWGLQAGYSFNGPIWSVSVECLVYGIFFLTLRYLGYSLWINISVIALGISWTGFGLSKEKALVNCLVFFYTGGLAALVKNYVADTRYNALLQRLALFFTLAIPICIYLTLAHQQKRFIFSFLWAYTPILLFWSGHPLRLHPALARILETAGNMTYSSYLLHFPIQLALAVYFCYKGKDIPETNPLFWFVFMGITLGLSFLTYRWFERPVQAYLRSSLLS